MLEICCTFRFQNDIFSMTLSLLQKKKMKDRKAKEMGMRWGKECGGGWWVTEA